MADPISRLLDSEQFRRYLSGRATPADEAELGRLAMRTGIDVADLATLREVIDKDEMWRRVARKTSLDPALIWRRPMSQPSPGAPHRATVSLPLPRRRVVPWWAGVAAAAVIVAGSTFAWYELRRDQVVLAHVVGAQAGQRIQYRLPDGSRVMLAPETELRYAAWDASGPREVALVGEAYFDVVHDETRPFRVRIGDAVVEDLGTEFVIRAYPDDENRRVAVRSGLVAVYGRTAPHSSGTRLEPGDVAEVDANGLAIKIAADTSTLFGWLTGQLVFRDAPVSAVLRGLQRWYGIKILAVDSTLLATELTLAIAERSTPAEAVAYVAALADVRVERRGNAFVLLR